MNHFSAYSLSCASEVDLPGLRGVESAGTPDVEIVVGQVDAPAEAGSWHRLGGDASTLAWEGVGRFAVEGGRRITVDARGELPLVAAHIVLGPAMALLLQQRGILPLHASAVEIDGSATLIAGPTESGKSTLARALIERGTRFVTDDIAALSVRDGRAWIAPGPAALRLWPATLEHLELQAPASTRVHELTEKVLSPVGGDGVATEPLAVERIVILKDGDRLATRERRGVDAAVELLAQVYYPELIGGASDPVALLESCAAIAKRAGVFELERPRGFEHLDALVEAILSQL